MHRTTSPHASEYDTKLTTVKVLKDYLRETAYCPPNIPSTNKALEEIMRAEMNNRNIACPQLERTLRLAAELVEVGYPECSLAEKTTIALFNWFMLYIDDTSSRDIGPFVVFPQRFLKRMPQLDPVLEALVEVLLRICDQYDTQTSNSILAATLNFINCICLEPEIEADKLMRGAVRFPWFFRDRIGLSLAYAHMMFPKSQGIGLNDYVQVLEDMNFWISAINDILSFHKEELVGEKGNYIHNRSHIEGKTLSQVLTEVGQEVLVSRNTIYASLARIPRARDLWSAFEHGYVNWHLTQERYKLADLNL